MKNYSSNRAQKGKTAYRTPSRYKVFKSMYEKPIVYAKSRGNWQESNVKFKNQKSK